MFSCKCAHRVTSPLDINFLFKIRSSRLVDSSMKDKKSWRQRNDTLLVEFRRVSNGEVTMNLLTTLDRNRGNHRVTSFDLNVSTIPDDRGGWFRRSNNAFQTTGLANFHLDLLLVRVVADLHFLRSCCNTDDQSTR